MVWMVLAATKPTAQPGPEHYPQVVLDTQRGQSAGRRRVAGALTRLP